MIGGGSCLGCQPSRPPNEKREAFKVNNRIKEFTTLITVIYSDPS